MFSHCIIAFFPLCFDAFMELHLFDPVESPSTALLIVVKELEQNRKQFYSLVFVLPALTYKLYNTTFFEVLPYTIKLTELQGVVLLLYAG